MKHDTATQGTITGNKSKPLTNHTTDKSHTRPAERGESHKRLHPVRSQSRDGSAKTKP